MKEEDEPEESDQDYYTDPLDTSGPEDGETKEESEDNPQEDNDDGKEDATPDEINKPKGKDEAGDQQPNVSDGDSSTPKLPMDPQQDSHSGGHDGQPKPSGGGNEGNRSGSGSGSSSRNSDDKPKAPSYGSNGSDRNNNIPDEFIYDPDEGDYMGSVDQDPNYEPIGRKPGRRIPKPMSKEDLNHLRSKGTPLELESLPPTEYEIDILSQYDISVEQIADTNYLAQLRLYQNLVERGFEPAESREDFVRNAGDVTTHRLKGGKWIHTCSAARGVMYISPTIWNMLLDEKCTICVYLDGRGKNFHYINTREEFLQLVEKDDVVIKITGKEKVEVVKELYSGLLENVKGTAYTLVRVASRTNMDAVFAHYVGAMAETNDGNDDNEYGS